MSDDEGRGFFPESTPPSPIERWVAPEEAMIDERNNEIEKLRGTLVFYADAQNYEYQDDATLGSTVSNAHYDEGEIARNALCRDE